jgi:hypothetical protein
MWFKGDRVDSEHLTSLYMVIRLLNMMLTSNVVEVPYIPDF